jgi:hypothetical protein
MRQLGNLIPAIVVERSISLLAGSGDESVSSFAMEVKTDASQLAAMSA